MKRMTMTKPNIEGQMGLDRFWKFLGNRMSNDI